MQKPLFYYWIRFTSTQESSEYDQFQMIELGALGTEEEENLVLKGSFSEKSLWVQASIEFQSRKGFAQGDSPWEDWDRSWRDRQTPVEVTSELTVCPPWVKAPSTSHTILLEAKMAFGTGSHESTRIAARLLEKIELKGKTILDVGTGTGILAIYAAKRGTKKAIGFDIDPVTGPCLAENLRLNSPLPQNTACPFYVGTLDSLHPTAHFDYVLCNMIRTEVWPYLESLWALLNPKGALLISGQRVEDQPFWQPWFQNHNASPSFEILMDEWWGFSLPQ